MSTATASTLKATIPHPAPPLATLDLRDYFAARILAALANQSHQLPERIVARAFELADLAIVARER